MHRLLSACARALRALLLLAVFAVPVYLFATSGESGPPDRYRPTSPQVRLPFTIPAYRQAIPVLVYHDLSDGRSRYTVSPELFERQLAALSASGFHTVTVQQLLGFLDDGRQLPSRPILLTFDDGLGSAWRVADPVLARYGMHGVSFVISGRIGQHGSYYLTNGELRKMVRSGRWDVEDHTDSGADEVEIDSEGHLGPSLASLAWLPDLRRDETVGEFASRAVSELDRSLATLQSVGARPQLFAYPPVGDVSADQAPAVRALAALVESRFPASFVDGSSDRFLDRFDSAHPHLLGRLEVSMGMTPVALLERLRSLVPLPTSLDGSLRQLELWSFAGIGRASPARLHDGVLTLRPQPRKWLAASLAPGRTNAWQGYRLEVDVGGLGAGGSGSSASVVVGESSADSPRYSITLSAGRVTLVRIPAPGARGRRLATRRVVPAAGHRLAIRFGRGRLTVSVDGRLLLTAPVDPRAHGGVTLGGWKTRASASWLRFGNLSIAPLASGEGL